MFVVLGGRKIADENFQGQQETVKYQTPGKQEASSGAANMVQGWWHRTNHRIEILEE